MKNAPPPAEVLYVRGGLATSASFSVDPNEDPEEARQDAIRRSKRARGTRRKKRRALEKRAAGGGAGA